MNEGARLEDHPLVLLVDDEEWTARSLESILKPQGYAVLRAYTGGQALELASKVRPHILLIDFRLPDITGVDLCARLRALPTIRASTPILIFSSGALARQDELDGFEAGAWGMLSPPFNPQDLLGRIGPLVAAKQDVDTLMESSFVDPLTGFYNVQGLMRRIAELSADTHRSGRPLAWVVVGPVRRDDIDIEAVSRDTGREAGIGPKEVTRALGELLGSSTRSSDAVGRVGDSDFLIVAPGTDREGAFRLAERVMDAVEKRAETQGLVGRLDLMASFHSVPDPKPAGLPPEELLEDAADALQRAATEADSSGATLRIRPFRSN